MAIKLSAFSRNVVTLMTGTTIAQAIPVAISPILTRIYTPQDFGVLAIFVAITMIIGTVSTGRYELAIILPEKNDEAEDIAALSLSLVILVSLVFLFVILIFGNEISRILGEPKIAIWLYVSPLSILFLGFFNILNYLNNRYDNYGKLAKANIVKSVVLASSQLILHFIHKGAFGLIVGQLLSSTAALRKLTKSSGLKKSIISSIFSSSLLPAAKRYIKFPLYSMPAILANTASIHLVNILLSAAYSIGTLGLYSLVQKVLILPSAVIGGAIGQVYFKEANAEKLRVGNAKLTFSRTLKKLLLIGVLFFVPLYFFVEDAFIIFFGDSWSKSGLYAKILVPLFFFRFVGAALSVTNSVFEKQVISLIWQIALLCISLGAITISVMLSFDFELFLKIFSVSLSVHYFILIIILFKVAKND